MKVCIVGSGHSQFGALHKHTLEDMIVVVVRQALLDAKLEAKDIDAVFLGNFNAGMSNEAFAATLIHQADDGFRFIPAVRCENACASGSAAISAAIHALLSRSAQRVLVVGAEKMTHNSTAAVTQALSLAGYQGSDERLLSFPQVFANYAKAYETRYSSPYQAMAKIAAKNHNNAVYNPLAHLHRAMTVEQCNTVSDKNPLIAPPLRLTDCSLISDGAAAVVLTTTQVAKDFARPVSFRAFSQVSDFLPMAKRDLIRFEGVKRSIHQAYQQAKVSINDINFAEVHDCFTIAELLMYEALGLCDDGCGEQVLDAGIVSGDGKLPVNLSGGLKAKGHPVGATGVSMHALAYRQLTDRAIGLSAPHPDLGIVVNMGGAGVTTYTSILQRGIA